MYEAQLAAIRNINSKQGKFLFKLNFIFKNFNLYLIKISVGFAKFKRSRPVTFTPVTNSVCPEIQKLKIN